MHQPQPRRAATQPVLLAEQSERQSRAAIERLDRIMQPVPPRLAAFPPLNKPGPRPEAEEVVTELA